MEAVPNRCPPLIHWEYERSRTFTFGIDDNQSVATLYDEDGGAALTFTTIPLTDIDRFPATRVIPAPDVSDDDAPKQIAEALLSFLNMNSFIHIDPSDVLQTCTSATVHVVRFRAENDANKAFSDALALQSINPTRAMAFWSILTLLTIFFSRLLHHWLKS